MLVGVCVCLARGATPAFFPNTSVQVALRRRVVCSALGVAAGITGNKSTYRSSEQSVSHVSTNQPITEAFRVGSPAASQFAYKLASDKQTIRSAESRSVHTSDTVRILAD